MAAIKQMRKAAALAVLAMSQTAAMAQVVVTYGPDVASVPTLSEWGMIIMSVLLAVVAVIAMRKNAGSKTVMSITLAAMMSFGVAGGSKWISHAWANGFTTYSMSAGTDGRLNVPTDDSFAYVLNDTLTPQRILNIAPQYADPQGVDEKPACVPGLLIAKTTSCALRTQAPPPPP